MRTISFIYNVSTTFSVFKYYHTFTLLLLLSLAPGVWAQTNTVYGFEAGSGYSYNSYFGYKAGNKSTISANYNSFFGAQAGANNTSGHDNAFFGFHAGSSNTVGSYNAFFGRYAGYANTVGGSNAFFGTDAGRTNTNGYNNSFFGTSAGLYNTTGINNAFFGKTAGRHNTSGGANAFFGYESGYANTTGNFNTMIGSGAGRYSTTAGNNTFIGSSAGRITTEGGSNVFLGSEAGTGNTTGYGNVYVGTGTGDDNSTGEKNVFLGYRAGNGETGSHKLYIENTTQYQPLIYGDFAQQRLALNAKSWPESNATFVVKTHADNGQAGMYIDANGNNGQPYYGYALGGTAKAKSYWHKGSGQLRFSNGSADRLVIDDNGWVGIGTNTTSTEYKLSVNGKIRAKGMKVETGWADFVFADDYKLRSLEEVKSFIQHHRHLPDVPSEAEVAKEGVDLGPMQAILLQKIEELTLYLLQAHEETQQLRKEVQMLKATTKKRNPKL